MTSPCCACPTHSPDLLNNAEIPCLDEIVQWLDIAPEWICEAHPWLPWPHHVCVGPGMLRTNLRDLHERAEVRPNGR